MVIAIRIVILSIAVLQATFVGMICGEQILISGRESLDQALARWCFGFLMAGGWMLMDFYFTMPQMAEAAPAWLLALLPHVPLIIAGGVIAYCIFRLRKKKIGIST